MLLSKMRNLLRFILLMPYQIILTKFYGMDISKNARISLGAKLDKTYPKGIHIGDETYIASGALIFSHDFSRSIHTDTYVGKKCFIGANSIIMPGVSIGNSVIIGAGSVVTKNIPDGSIAVGNPAKIINDDIETCKFGKLLKEK